MSTNFHKLFLYINLLYFIPFANCENSYSYESYFAGNDSEYSDFTDEQCRGPNEVYLICGSPCELTCDDYWYDMPCDKPCVSGCFCKPGYVRNVKFRCMLPEHCDLDIDELPTPECHLPHEVFMACGTECPFTCQNYKNTPECSKKCIAGCFCEAGYVRDEIGFCVLPKECPPSGMTISPQPVCRKANQTYSICGTQCPLTCANYKNPPTCKNKCVAGCFCDEEYVRDYKNNCILPKDCPEAPPIIIDPSNSCKTPYEEYLICGSACPRTCENFNATISCPLTCVEGCFCKKGFVRDHKNRCVPPEYCTEKPFVECRYLEEPATEKRPCSGTCDEPNKCVPGDSLLTCVCMSGTVKDDNNQCILPEYCPMACEDLNEIFDCASPCDTVCDQLGKPCKYYSYDCVPQCYCRSGYARDHRYRCVPISKCPITTPVTDIFYKTVDYVLL